MEQDNTQMDSLKLPGLQAHGARGNVLLHEIQCKGAELLFQDTLRLIGNGVLEAGGFEAVCSKIPALYYGDETDSIFTMCHVSLCYELEVFKYLDPEHISRRRYAEALSEAIEKSLIHASQDQIHTIAALAWVYSSPIDILSCAAEDAAMEMHQVAEAYAYELCRIASEYYEIDYSETLSSKFSTSLGLYPMYRPLLRAISLQERTSMLLSICDKVRSRIGSSDSWLSFIGALERFLNAQSEQALREPMLEGLRASEEYTGLIESMQEQEDRSKREDLLGDYFGKLGVRFTDILREMERRLKETSHADEVYSVIEAAHEKTSNIVSLMIVTGSLLYEPKEMKRVIFSCLESLYKEGEEYAYLRDLMLLLIPAAFFNFDEATLLSEENLDDELAVKYAHYQEMLKRFCHGLALRCSKENDAIVYRRILHRMDSPLRSHAGFGISDHMRVLKDLGIEDVSQEDYSDLELSALANSWLLIQESKYYSLRLNS